MERIKKHMMVILLSSLIIPLLFSYGCIEDSSSDTLPVLVTIIPQQEMVEAIGGDHVTVTTLVPEGQSPHSYEPLPSQMVKVAQAEAYFIVGSGVEFEQTNMDVILEQNPSIKVFDCSEHIEIKSFDQHYGYEDNHEGDGEHDQNETEDHDHQGTDPHVWTSPLNVKKMAEVIYNGLKELDPGNNESYTMNYQNYIASLDSLHQNISQSMEPYHNRSFLVYHPAWGYFGDTYQLKQIAIEDEGKQPGPAGVADIISQARNESITVIFVSPQFDISSATVIADEIHGEVIYANPLMSNYHETLLKITKEMIKGFQE
jgi:zinc transport system substrate-binding protein